MVKSEKFYAFFYYGAHTSLRIDHTLFHLYLIMDAWAIKKEKNQNAFLGQ